MKLAAMLLSPRAASVTLAPHQISERAERGILQCLFGLTLSDKETAARDFGGRRLLSLCMLKLSTVVNCQFC